MKFIASIIISIALIVQLKGEENHALPLLCSFALPGGGQFYNGRILKGTFYASLEAGLLYGAIIQNQRYRQAVDGVNNYSGSKTDFNYRKLDHEVRFYRKERDSFIWLSAASVLLSAGDAFVDSYFKEFKRDKFASWEVIPYSNGVALVYNF